jgi:hypothetical protein
MIVQPPPRGESSSSPGSVQQGPITRLPAPSRAPREGEGCLTALATTLHWPAARGKADQLQLENGVSEVNFPSSSAATDFDPEKISMTP